MNLLHNGVFQTKAIFLLSKESLKIIFKGVCPTSNIIYCTDITNKQKNNNMLYFITA